MKRYYIGIVAVILVIVVAFTLVSNMGNRSATPADNTKKTAQLIDYADKNSEVTFTTIGRLVGNDEHREIRVVVSANERRIEIISGYDQQIISSQSYSNNQAAYETFLSALGGQGYITSKKSTVDDSRSVCPTGQHYEYIVKENGEEKSNLWSVSCDKTGSFNGRASTIRELFHRQIPDYNKQVTGITL
jgi:hypothetical protein